MAPKRTRVAGANDHEAGTSNVATNEKANGKAPMREEAPPAISRGEETENIEVGPIFIQGFMCMAFR